MLYMYVNGMSEGKEEKKVKEIQFLRGTKGEILHTCMCISYFGHYNNFLVQIIDSARM